MAYDQASSTNVTPTRRYDPITGRWDSPDTDGFMAGDTNLYRYVGTARCSTPTPPAVFFDPFTWGVLIVIGIGLPLLSRCGHPPPHLPQHRQRRR